jgi:hypothetical protein
MTISVIPDEFGEYELKLEDVLSFIEGADKKELQSIGEAVDIAMILEEGDGNGRDGIVAGYGLVLKVWIARYTDFDQLMDVLREMRLNAVWE